MHVGRCFSLKTQITIGKIANPWKTCIILPKLCDIIRDGLIFAGDSGSWCRPMGPNFWQGERPGLCTCIGLRACERMPWTLHSSKAFAIKLQDERHGRHALILKMWVMVGRKSIVRDPKKMNPMLSAYIFVTSVLSLY